MSQAFELCQVHVSGRLLDAMHALDRSGTEIALVVEDGGRLFGTLTDGDIRRALLRGAALDSSVGPHAHRNFTSVDRRANRVEVIELMQARSLRQIPVLDEEGRLIGLHLLHKLIGVAERPNWGVIMAGGRGLRLRPYTEQVPKPMLRVAGRPILERLVLHMVGCGIRRIFLAINYLGNVVEEYFRDGARFGCQIDYLRETKPLGSGGALALLPEPREAIVVMNGDLVTQIDLGALLSFHTSGRYAATVAVRPYSYTVPFGCVELDGHQIVQLEEKPAINRIVNAGIYVFNPELIGRVPRDEEWPMTAMIQQCLNANEPVGAFEMLDDWIDVGEHDQLRLARGGS